MTNGHSRGPDPRSQQNCLTPPVETLPGSWGSCYLRSIYDSDLHIPGEAKKETCRGAQCFCSSKPDHMGRCQEEDGRVGANATFPTCTYAAAAQWLQSCPTLCDPIDGSPPGSPVPGILQARTLAWVAISFSNAWKWKVKVKSLSRVWLFATLWTAAYQAPPSMGFPRQEYWSGVPLPSPDLHLWGPFKC